MSDNSFEKLDYFIFCITNEKYIENTYVSLHSFYKYNNYPVTVFLCDCETERFKEFEKVKTEKIEFIFNNSHFRYGEDIKPIIAKLLVFDNSPHKYNLSFDTDTLFLGSIKDVIKEYEKSYIGVLENEKSEINAGFVIYKKKNFSLFKKFMDIFNSHGMFNCPEQTFLNFIFKNDCEQLSTRYNYCYWTKKIGEDEKPIMIHYAGTNKPFYFRKMQYEYLIKDQIKYFLLYFNYCENLNLEENFKKEIELAKKRCKNVNSLFYNSNKGTH